MRHWQPWRGGLGGRIAAGLIAAAVAAGCRTPAAPRTIRIAHESDVISLDPAAFRESATQSILSNLCEGLVAFDADMRLRPALAINWSTPDENSWLIQLRPGVRFHDGHPLDARDVKYSLDRARSDPKSGVQGQLSNIEQVDVLDALTLRLRTREVEPLLMNRLAYILIVPASEYRYDPSRIVGTGPYKLVRWDRGRLLEAEAWDGYWGGRPRIDHVHFVPLEEGKASIQALREGRVEVLRWVPETLADELDGVAGVSVASRPGLATYYLWFNSLPASGAARNPFADRRVRQAISQALDRRAIVGGLKGRGVPAYQLVQAGVFGHVADLPELPFEPQAARRLLAEAGYPDGFDTRLVHRAQTSMATVAGLIRDMLAPIGIRVALEVPPWPDVVAGWNSAAIPFLLAGWRFEEGDASGFLRDCLFTRDPVRRIGNNNAGYSNPELDRLIEQSARTLGDAKRLRSYESAMRFALDDMPVVPVYHKDNLFGVARRVRWQPRLDGKLLAAEMDLE
jgi:peptide/nickel transport system substrate-binding protein